MNAERGAKVHPSLIQALANAEHVTTTSQFNNSPLLTYYRSSASFELFDEACIPTNSIKSWKINQQQKTAVLAMEDASIRRRAACDRCHSQKLKCPKAAGSKVCDRCIKARATCLYSPFRQKKDATVDAKKMKTSIDAQLSSLEDRLNTFSENNLRTNNSTTTCGTKRKRDCTLTSDPGPGLEPEGITLPTCDVPEIDWTTYPFNELEVDPLFGDFDFGNTYPQLDFFPTTMMNPQSPKEGFNLQRAPSFLERPFEKTTSNTQLEATNTAPPRGPPAKPRDTREPNYNDNPISQQSERDLIQSLSTLSLELYDHLNTIPPQSVHAAGFVEDPDNPISSQFASFSTDQTFQLTQDLVDVYPLFFDMFFTRRHSNTDTPSSKDSPSEEFPPSNQIQNSLGNQVMRYNPMFDSEPIVVDHSSVLLLLSCHTRLLDIFDELFQHMDICVDKLEQKSYVRCSFDAPSLKVANYTPSPSVAAAMQMLLLIQLSSRLSANVNRLAEHISASQQDMSNGPSEGLGDRVDALALSLVAAERVKCRAAKMTEHIGFMEEAMLEWSKTL